ncbi:hypothetical protein [Streptomyces coffeae]|nr:hypothetical protein [Streptomyces coffeae]
MSEYAESTATIIHDWLVSMSVPLTQPGGTCRGSNARPLAESSAL